MSVEEFYNKFSAKFIEDLVNGNERVDQQLIFLQRAIPATTKSVLVIGCGSGQGAHFIATRVAKEAKILAVDISPENLRLARAVFSHPNITYFQADVTTDRMDGRFEVTVLPDVYEHIPINSRGILHDKLRTLLAGRGRILLTIPSPQKQRSLPPEELQIVDEIVTLQDLNELAVEVAGTLTYFNTISVWQTNDYIHAAIEGDASVREIEESDRVELKGWKRRTLTDRVIDVFNYRLGFKKLTQGWARRQITRKLK